MSTIQNPSAQLSVVLEFYKAVSTWKFGFLEAKFSDDYIHKTLPATANDPPKNKAQGIEYAKCIGKSLGYAPLQVRSVSVNWSRNHVLYHSTRSSS